MTNETAAALAHRLTATLTLVGACAHWLRGSASAITVFGGVFCVLHITCSDENEVNPDVNHSVTTTGADEVLDAQRGASDGA